MSQIQNGKRHAIVVGAGTVGACCAWHLVKAGLQVTLIDRDEPGQATSFGNAAGISASQVTPFSYPGVWKSIPGWLFDPLGPLTIRWKDLPAVAPWLWRFWRAGTAASVQASSASQAALMHCVQQDFDDLLNEAGLQHYMRCRGLIQVYDQPQQFEADRWRFERAEELGFDWEMLEPGAVRKMAPALSLNGGQALYVPSWQHVTDPAAMTADIAGAALKTGASWMRDEVTLVQAAEPGHESDSGVSVKLSSGRKLSADQLIIAAGPWSNQLAGQLDGTVPMTPKRGYHAQVPGPGFELEYPVLSGSRNFVMTPLTNGFRIAGTAEFARLDADPDYRRADVLLEHARHYFPDLRTEGASQWMGQRPMMVDSLPIISASPRYPGVFYAYGHGHYGLTQGPTTGRIIACLALGKDPGLDLTPYRHDRF